MLEKQEVLDLAKLAWHGHVVLRANCIREIAMAMSMIPDWQAVQQAWRFDGFTQGMLYVLGDDCPQEQQFIQQFTDKDLDHIRSHMSDMGRDLYTVELPDEGVDTDEVKEEMGEAGLLCNCDQCVARRAMEKGGMEALKEHMERVLEEVDKKDPHEAEFLSDMHLAIEAAIKTTMAKHGRSEEKYKVNVGSISVGKKPKPGRGE